MDVAPDTVDKRILAATTKLGVARRTALVAEALRRGIIAPLAVSLLAVLIALQSNPSNVPRRPEPGRRAEMRLSLRRVEDSVSFLAAA